MATELFSLAGKVALEGTQAVNAGLKETQKQTSQLQKELGKLGPSLSKVGASLSKQVTGPVGAATEMFGFLSARAGDYANKLLTLNQNTGLATDYLQEMAHAATETGGSSDGLFTVVGKLYGRLGDAAKGLGAAAEAFDEFKFSVETIGGLVGDTVNKIGSLFARSLQEEVMRLDKEYNERKEYIEANVEDEEERNAQLAALDEETDARRLELQKEQASRDKALGIFNTIIDTAAAVVKALTAGPFLGPVMAGIIGALGVAQIAVIEGTPEPFYAGGLIKGSRSGIVAQIGERNQDEVILPLEKGTAQIAQKLQENGGSGGATYVTNYHISNVYGGEKGLKELERRLEPIRVQEARRTGRA